MAYTVKEKATAIAILQEHGEISQRARDDIWEAIGKTPSKSTLHEWVTKLGIDLSSESSEIIELNRTVKKMPTSEDIEEAKKSLPQLFQDVAEKYLEHAVKDETIKDLKGQQAVTAAAIATDKILKLHQIENVPPELLKVLPDFMDAAVVRNLNPTQIIIDLTNKLNMMVVKSDSAVH